MKAKPFKIEQFRPLYDNLIIKPIKIEENDGLIRPQQEEDKAELGEVIAVSKELAKDFKVGDIVLFNRFSTTKVLLGGEISLRAEDIIAVYE